MASGVLLWISPKGSRVRIPLTGHIGCRIRRTSRQTYSNRRCCSAALLLRQLDDALFHTIRCIRRVLFLTAGRHHRAADVHRAWDGGLSGRRGRRRHAFRRVPPAMIVPRIEPPAGCSTTGLARRSGSWAASSAKRDRRLRQAVSEQTRYTPSALPYQWSAAGPFGTSRTFRLSRAPSNIAFSCHSLADPSTRNKGVCDKSTPCRSNSPKPIFQA